MNVHAYRAASFGSVLACVALIATLTNAQPAPDAGAAPEDLSGGGGQAPAEAPAGASAEAEGAPAEPPAEAPAGAPPVSAAPLAEAAGGEPQQGQVHLVVFGGNAPAAGATVRLSDGTEVRTDSVGSANLDLPPGEHTLQLIWPADAPPKVLPRILVASNKTTEVIATVNEDGSLTPDVQVPVGATSAPEAQQLEAVETGTLSGTVIGDEDGEPIQGVGVFVAGQTVEATTDAQGRFTMVLPVGVHTLSLIHAKFSTQTVNDVAITANETTPLEVSLTPAAIELQEFVVSAPYISGGVAGLLNQRRKSAAVSDSIGAEDISRMPANNAAQAAQRVVGATIVGGRFVYVRGLGERYSNALLNGAPLPSPEPDRATVPLDLFPSQILASLDISKTFTPDVPGNFAGGSVRIKTKDVPDGFLFGASFSLGANTQSTLKEHYGQANLGSLDFLALDDGSRDLDSGIPDTYFVRAGVKDRTMSSTVPGNRVTEEERVALSPLMDGPFYLKRRTLLPNFNGSAAIGKSWKLGPDSRIGVLSSIIYRRNGRYRDEERNEFANVDPEGVLIPSTRYTFEKASDEVRWGAFATVTLELTKKHKLSLLGMHSQLGDRTAFLFDGYNRQQNGMIAGTRQEFITRGLTNGQLQGEHTFDPLNGAQVNWLLSLAHAGRDEDDTRDLAYALNNGVWSLLGDVTASQHFFSEQSEVAHTYGFDWTQPILGGPDGNEGWAAWKLKGGFLLSFKDRDFDSRTFNFRPQESNHEDLTCGETFDPITCPRQTFARENLGPVLLLQEGTQPQDSYVARLNVQAGYGMTEIGFGDMWRLIGGMRVEQTLQTLDVVDLFTGEVTTNEQQRARLEQADLLPAASIVFSPIENGAIRLAISQTLARPQLRELSPLTYVNYFGGFRENGNPDLELTRILNGDLRFEYFPSPQEVVAVSLFAKNFTDPIEPVFLQRPDAPIITYRNAEGAQLFGTEVEVRKNLGFLTETLAPFGVIASVMLSTSEIEVRSSADGESFLTNLKRPLVQAAPYVINAAIDYENSAGTQARILYNVSGPRLVTVGVNGIEDAYLHPQHSVDLTASQQFGDHFKLRLNVQNLLNATYLVTQGKDLQSFDEELFDDNVLVRYKEGVSASIGIAYDH